MAVERFRERARHPRGARARAASRSRAGIVVEFQSGRGRTAWPSRRALDEAEADGDASSRARSFAARRG
jgi:hypothetical protein